MTEFTDEQREKAMELLDDSGYLDIVPVEEFMTAYEPYEVARIVRQSSLNLDHAYVRVNTSSSDAQEADDRYSLVSDDEVEEALNKLQ